MIKFTSKDIIALICILGLFALLFMGYDGWVQATITTIIAYYFFVGRNQKI